MIKNIARWRNPTTRVPVSAGNRAERINRVANNNPPVKINNLPFEIREIKGQKCFSVCVVLNVIFLTTLAILFVILPYFFGMNEEKQDEIVQTQQSIDGKSKMTIMTNEYDIHLYPEVQFYFSNALKAVESLGKSKFKLLDLQVVDLKTLKKLSDYVLAHQNLIFPSNTVNSKRQIWTGLYFDVASKFPHSVRSIGNLFAFEQSLINGWCESLDARTSIIQKAIMEVSRSMELSKVKHHLVHVLLDVTNKNLGETGCLALRNHDVIHSGNIKAILGWYEMKPYPDMSWIDRSISVLDEGDVIHWIKTKLNYNGFRRTDILKRKPIPLNVLEKIVTNKRIDSLFPSLQSQKNFFPSESEPFQSLTVWSGAYLNLTNKRPRYLNDTNIDFVDKRVWCPESQNYNELLKASLDILNSYKSRPESSRDDDIPWVFPVVLKITRPNPKEAAITSCLFIQDSELWTPGMVKHNVAVWERISPSIR